MSSSAASAWYTQSAARRRSTAGFWEYSLRRFRQLGILFKQHGKRLLLKHHKWIPETARDTGKPFCRPEPHGLFQVAGKVTEKTSGARSRIYRIVEQVVAKDFVRLDMT